jgi:hypothetical protein
MIVIGSDLKNLGSKERKANGNGITEKPCWVLGSFTPKIVRMCGEERVKEVD